MSVWRVVGVVVEQSGSLTSLHLNSQETVRQPFVIFVPLTFLGHLEVVASTLLDGIITAGGLHALHEVHGKKITKVKSRVHGLEADAKGGVQMFPVVAVELVSKRE